MTDITRTRHTLEFQPVKSINLDDKGWLHFTAISNTEDFLPSSWLKYAAEDSVGKHFVYRHRLPSDPEHKDEPYYGRIKASRVEVKNDKNTIISDYFVKNTIERQRKLQELITRRQREGRPMGVSMQYDVYRNKDGNIVDIDVVEHSSTWKPAVKEAVILEKGLTTMPDPKDKELETPIDKDTDKQEDDEDEEQKTDVIQKQLDDKEIEALEVKLEAKEKEVKELNQTVSKFGKKFEDMAKRLIALERHNDILEKTPVIMEIFKVEKDDDLRTNTYPTWDKEKLAKRLEYVKSRPRIEIRTETALETGAREMDKVSKEDATKYLVSAGFTREQLKKMEELI